jgi:hypothetical protein
LPLQEIHMWSWFVPPIVVPALVVLGIIATVLLR